MFGWLILFARSDLAKDAEILILRRRCCGRRKTSCRVDELLDDPVFFAPFAPHFHPVIGRPSAPVEWYLRVMFLKFRHGLG